MIVPDLNLLIYAYNEAAPFHEDAKRWWEDLVNGGARVGIPWVVSIGFVRLMTHPRVLVRPMAPTQAVDFVLEWFRFPNVVPVHPGTDHLFHFRRNLLAAGVGGNLVTDSHLAAIAMEYQAELHSNDSDFARFPGLRWRKLL